MRRVGAGAGRTCEFRYTYTPAEVGADIVELGLEVEGVPYTVSLTGTGVPAIEVSSTALAFGMVVVGETAALDAAMRPRTGSR
ncbi:hypothetical protein E1262_20490 [Jiangella aurantiaca]|uniref:Uncharacterized protein n=1 Tax=Jiangella aurantiaca TaxID=2530373 RepID=A0A4R5A511_9ACTN|nr:hypothetical protein [Jiangella aurantiaca]TDD67001.1 hypothetical protein E1262_20490 [Jiangella aurantiaca]